MRTFAFVLLAALAGCKREPVPAPTAPAVYLPGKLAAEQGIIFAATQGATVEAKTKDGAAVALADGARVAVIEEREAAVGDVGPSTIEIASDGKRLVLPLLHVLSEDRLARSDDGRYAVFSAIETCGDLCHTALYIVAGDGRRAKLGDGVVDGVVAWRRGGGEVAIGSGSLWLVSLPALTVRFVGGYTAPAYAPDGTLYVRDRDGSAYTLDAGTAVRVYEAPPRAPADDDDYGAEDPLPVQFDTAGKPKYK